MKVAKQFVDVESGVSVLLSKEDKFVPEMSLPLETILAQFSYVDNIRMGEIAQRGYEAADTDEENFDVEDFDRLDPAEREEVYSNAKSIVERYQEQMRRQKEEPENTVDEDILP